jgi:integrase
VLGNFMNWATRGGYIDRNPVPLADWPKSRMKAPPVLEEQELRELLERVDDPFARALIVFVAYTGLRRGELERLEVKHLDLEQGTVWVRGKTGDQHHPLAPQAIKAARTILAQQAEGIQYLIAGSTERARRNRVAETFRRWQRKLHEPRLRPHAMRHSAATIMIRNGVSPAAVQRFLRHSSYAMTQRYVNLVGKDVQEATSKLHLVS